MEQEENQAQSLTNIETEYVIASEKDTTLATSDKINKEMDKESCIVAASREKTMERCKCKDGLVISSDGNLLDALGAAIKDHEKVKTLECRKLKVHVSFVEKNFVIREQGRPYMRINKKGGSGLDPVVILDRISMAKHVSETLMSTIDSEISAAEADEED